MLIRDQNWFYIAHSVDELGGSGLRSGYMRKTVCSLLQKVKVDLSMIFI